MTLLNILNPSAEYTPAPEPAESPTPAVTEATNAVNASNNAVKRWQLERGRTKKRLEDLTRQCEDARANLAPAMQAHGAALYEEKDSTEEALAVQQAGNRIAALESALKIAIQKDEAALIDLRAAERDLKSAAQEAARQALLELTEEGEEILLRIKKLRADTVRQAGHALEVGGIQSWGAREVVDHWDFFLKIANRSAAADAADSGAFRKFPSWTYCVQYACGKVKP